VGELWGKLLKELLAVRFSPPSFARLTPFKNLKKMTVFPLEKPIFVI
jgi:hypothetical protein